MFILKGRANGRRFVLLGLPGSMLGGIRNSGMVATLDGIRAAPMAKTFDGADFVSILRADSIEELRRKGIEAGLEEGSLEVGGARPGLVQKPKGGLD